MVADASDSVTTQPFLIDESAHTAYRLKGVVRIGRAPENTIMVTDPRVSRLHAEVWMEGEIVFLRSLGSNGTRINGKRVPGTWELEEGDQVEVGWTTFRYTAQPLPLGVHSASRGIASAVRRSDTEAALAGGDVQQGTVHVGKTAPSLPPIGEVPASGVSRRVWMVVFGILTAAALAVLAALVLGL